MDSELIKCFVKYFNSLYDVLKFFEKKSYYQVSKYDRYFENKISKDWNYDNFLNSLVKTILSIEPQISTVISCFILIDRLLNVNKKLLKRENLLNLVTISLIISHKFNEDNVYIDKCYCQVLNTNINGLCSLEIIFCELIKYKLYISQKTYQKYSEEQED